MTAIRINGAPAEPAAPAGAVAPEVKQNADGSLTVSEGVAPAEAVKPDAPGGEPAAKPDAPAAGEPTIPKIVKPAEAPKFDAAAALADIGKDGKVSEATYAEYAKSGIDRAALDTFVAGHKAQVNTVVTKLTEIAGDEASLRTVMEWAGSNVDAATADAFNAALDRADATTASLMLRGLMAQYGDAVGVEGNRLVGAAKATGVQAYGSYDEVRIDMSNPRYNNDPSFRAQVEARMRAAMKAGNL